MTDKPWYHKGLRFECQRSGNCCKTHGEYAYVYLAPPDVTAIAAFLELSEAEFLARHCRAEDGYTLLDIDAPECPFLGPEHACAIYPVRPKQCATWPFWQETLADPARWHGEVSACCPGIGRGPLIPVEEVERQARETERWYEGEDAE